MMVGNESPLERAGTWLDDLLIEYKVLPARSNTKGKSLLLAGASALLVWLVVHFHLGYVTAIVFSIPLFIVGTFIYTEHELSKDD